MRIRQRRRIRWGGAVVKPAASQSNERWSMDFVSDCVSGGKVIRMLTIADDTIWEVKFFLRHDLASSLDFRLRFSDQFLHDRRILELRQWDLLDSLTHRLLAQ